MQANVTKLQDMIEGTRQYMVPHFQRTYSWEEKEWEQLWEDLIELCEKPKNHFFGTIVTKQIPSGPEGIVQYQLIDGQQRLTSLFIILALIRNKAKENGNVDLANEINNTLLVNQYKKGDDFFKIVPTQVDREAYRNLVNNGQIDIDNQIINAYNFFDKKLIQNTFDNDVLNKIKKVITSYLSVISFVLGPDDDPYQIFESLNAKGKQLSKADLIRNYFFMRISVDIQDDIYNKLWLPMQIALQDNLTEYIKHYLMRQGSGIKERDIYSVLKENAGKDEVIEYLEDLSKYSNYYQKLLNPELEADIDIRKYLKRLNRIDITTVYPLLLNFYNYRTEGKIDRDNFVDVLRTIENYLIRRYICGIPTNSLNKIFPSVILQLDSKYKDDPTEGLKILLQSKDYPKDEEFKSKLKEINYGGKIKVVLESFENFYGHKEVVPCDNLTIEHIMPQKPTEWWKEHLGEGWEILHEKCVHNIGNLTLTAYNTELSNSDFPTKKEFYKDSHLELNKYFNSVNDWNEQEIERRANLLADIATKIWPYFGKKTVESATAIDVDNKTEHHNSMTGTNIRPVIETKITKRRDASERVLMLLDLDEQVKRRNPNRKRYYIREIVDLLPEDEKKSEGYVRSFLSYGRFFKRKGLLEQMSNEHWREEDMRKKIKELGGIKDE